MTTKDDLLTLAMDWAESEEESGTLILGYSLHYCLLHHVYDEFFPIPKGRTARQREQQKLASQLRSITGMIGLARHLRYTGNGMLFYPLDRAISDMRQVETGIRHLMKNIKERIPNE